MVGRPGLGARPLPGGGKSLSGGFGRLRVAPRFTPEPVGVYVDAEKSVVVYRPDDAADGGVALALPETGLKIAGWAGDPRTAQGLYLAAICRGLFLRARHRCPCGSRRGDLRARQRGRRSA